MVRVVRDAKLKRGVRIRGRTGSCTIRQGVVKGRGREVEGAERAYLLVVFFFSLFFFCNQIVIMFKGTKDSCSASYGDKKPISKRHPTRFTSSWEKSNTPNP